MARAAVECRVGREHAGPDGHREVAPVLGALPPIGRGVGCRVPVEALVLDELSRVFRHAAPREGRRHAHDGESEVPGHGHGDHVVVDHLAELDARVEALRHDVDRCVAHDEVEPDVGVLREEAGSPLTPRGSGAVLWKTPSPKGGQFDAVVQREQGEPGVGRRALSRDFNRTSAQYANFRVGLLRGELPTLLLAEWNRPEQTRGTGRVVIHGRARDGIIFADADGSLVTLYFDAATHLLVRSEFLADDPTRGDAAISTDYSDYRSVNALKLPFRTQQDGPGPERWQTTLTRAELGS